MYIIGIMDNEKSKIGINKDLYDEIVEYCKLNELRPNEFINKILKKAFATAKYGNTPFFNYNKELDMPKKEAVPILKIETAIREAKEEIKKPEIIEQPKQQEAVIEQKTEQIIESKPITKKRRLK